jgi:hypothetical protein
VTWSNPLINGMIRRTGLAYATPNANNTSRPDVNLYLSALSVSTGLPSTVSVRKAVLMSTVVFSKLLEQLIFAYVEIRPSWQVKSYALYGSVSIHPYIIATRLYRSVLTLGNML